MMGNVDFGKSAEFVMQFFAPHTSSTLARTHIPRKNKAVERLSQSTQSGQVTAQQNFGLGTDRLRADSDKQRERRKVTRQSDKEQPKSGFAPRFETGCAEA